MTKKQLIREVLHYQRDFETLEISRGKMDFSKLEE